MTLAFFRQQLLFVLATIALFLVTLVMNTVLFKAMFEHTPGIAWVYLPAGVRLLCTLLFGGAGGIGLFIGGWGVNSFYHFPDDPARAFAGAVAGALAPWLTYRVARLAWGLQASLRNLTPGRLLSLSAAYSIASPLFHHLYFAWTGQPGLASGFMAMVTGDLVGTLLVLYSIKWVLGRTPAAPR
ncbi:MAG: hypothetical protein ACO1PB_03970 [Ramlibacter sp.]